MLVAGEIADVFRAERARVLATTIRVCHGDFELAEEVVQEAFAAALARWPGEGVPDEPRGWLVQVARHKAVDAIRRNVKFRQIVAEELEVSGAGAGTGAGAESAPAAVADDRLRLIFTCCHPALAREAQVALTLRTLGGLTTEEIARAFVASPVTMAQRLVRAKTKIRDAGIPYEVPEASELAPRLDAVMAVVYLIFNEGYAATAGDAWLRKDLCREAIRLARLVVELTSSAEAQGLLALMLLHDARRDTRTDAAGDVVLLEDQDRARWDRAQITEALALVPGALASGPAGPVRHPGGDRGGARRGDRRARDGLAPDRRAVRRGLARRAPSPIVALNRAVAIAMADGPAAGLAAIEPLRDELAGYHLLHAARADLLRRLGRERTRR